MCLLIVKPAGIEIPFSTLTSAALANPHGAGIAWSDGGAVTIAKNAKWGGAEVARELEKLKAFPALIHFRYATHGGRNNENAHPFALPSGYAAAHNGVISGIPCGEDESDTRAFLRLHVAPLLERGAALHDAAHIASLEALHGKGNKMAFLSPGGRYTITNEKAGTWKGGAWLSNLNHEWSMEDERESRWQSWSRESSRKASRRGKVESLPLVAWHEKETLFCEQCGADIKSRFATVEDCIFCPACLGEDEDGWPF